jgi:hypothetical protein
VKTELDKALCAKYPKIFCDRHADMKETAMCWGFECGDGWYQILDSLCANIQSHIDWSHKNHAWDLQWNEEHPEEQRPVREPVHQVVATQVKEKFGGLRFYYNGGDDVIDGMVRMAESWAVNTCETCGNLGTMRHGGWIRTLCDKHEEEYQERNLLRQGLEG